MKLIIVLSILLAACVNDGDPTPTATKTFRERCKELPAVFIYEPNGGQTCEGGPKLPSVQPLCKEYGAVYKEVDPGNMGCTIKA